MDGTNENKKFPVLPMEEEWKPLLKNLNNFLMCRLCGGYLIEATSIVECFHTYCRSCIVQFLQNSKFCPICEVQVHKTKPCLSLRSDTIIQRLVYKAVPGLYKNELQRRKQFLLDSGVNDFAPSEDDDSSEEYYFAPEEPISISLEYVENDIGDENDPTSKDVVKCNGKTEQITHRRYLQCPAALKIEHIYKFIKLKYNLKNNHEVEVLYENMKLPSCFSLMDTAYTFSWSREAPMRLCYQIFERTRVPVPIVISNKISDDFVSVKNSNFLTNSSSHGLSSETTKSTSETSFKSAESDTSSNSTSNSTKPNLKRKTETITEKLEADPVDQKCDYFELLEPSIKISRVITDRPPPKDDGDKEVAELEVSSGTVNDFKPAAGNLPPFSEEFTNYEQDIEEVEDDDDDEDRLRISQLSEDDTQDDKMEDTSEQLVIDTSDAENNKEQRREERHDDKKSRYKRKSKKSKHHHHHKHHHRHHERKKAAPQATILHSPDTDIMKLKVKLNNVKPDTKYHKQSKRKRKKSPESYLSSYSSSSSVSSISAPSPDTISVSRTDEDSLHSQISDVSVESVETSSSKEEPTSTFKTEKPATVKPAESELEDKLRSPTNKEKLLQMRNFRPKSIAIVRPEEHDKRVVEITTKIESNDKPSSRIVEHERPKAVSAEVLRPTSSSSVTVSKVTALKMEQDKLQMNGSKEDPPALEIIPVVNNSSKATSSVASAVFVDAPISSKPSKLAPKSMRPPPPVIPWSHYQKMMSTEYKLPKSTEYKLPKSLSIHVTTNSPSSMKLSADSKKTKDAIISKVDGMKQNVTFFRSENFYENDSALDLSAGKPINVLNKKTVVNGMRSNGLPSNYSPLHSMSSQANAVRPFQKTPPEMYTNKMNNTRYPSAPSPRNHKIPSSTQISASKSQTSMRSNVMKQNASKATTIPQLNEIKIGPSSSGTQLKPRLNQNVRSIPDLSLLLQRQQAQAVANLGMMPNPTSMMHGRFVATPCSFNMKKNSDMCPPALPINKGYLDRTTIMATK